MKKNSGDCAPQNNGGPKIQLGGTHTITLSVVIGLAALLWQQVMFVHTEISEHAKISWHAGTAETVPAIMAQVKALEVQLDQKSDDRFRGKDWKNVRRDLDNRFDKLEEYDRRTIKSIDDINKRILAHEELIAIIRERITRLE